MIIQSATTGEEQSASQDSASTPAKAKKAKRGKGRPKGAKESIRRQRKILQLHSQGLSNRQIAAIVDRHPSQVDRMLNRFKGLIDPEELQEFRNFKLDLIDTAKLRTLKSVLDESKHADANLRDSAQAFKILNEASRLERCLPTKAQAIAFTHVQSPVITKPE